MVYNVWCCTKLELSQNTHFKNELIDNLNKNLHAHHYFTTPYIFRSNGTLEIVCKDVLRAAPTLLFQLRMDMKQWPLFLDSQKLKSHGVIVEVRYLELVVIAIYTYKKRAFFHR